MTKKMVLILLCFSLWPFSKARGQERADMDRDKMIISNFYSKVQFIEGESMGDLIIRVAHFFLNTPYVGATLEVGDEERLIINLRELDCTTFMESCVALARVIQRGTPTFESYCMELERNRYRDGVMDGYVSRLHYTTDWIANNAKKGVVEEVTGKIGGDPFPLNLSFMSSNSEKYKHLQGKPDRVVRIKEIEDALNSFHGYHYIPKEKIRSLQEGIQNGDIIGFTTSTEGMDISHIGIAYRQNSVLTFIHASSTAKKVIINPESLSDYCTGIRSNTGIVVARVL